VKCLGAGHRSWIVLRARHRTHHRLTVRVRGFPAASMMLTRQPHWPAKPAQEVRLAVGFWLLGSCVCVCGSGHTAAYRGGGGTPGGCGGCGRAGGGLGAASFDNLNRPRAPSPSPSPGAMYIGYWISGPTTATATPRPPHPRPRHTPGPDADAHLLPPGPPCTTHDPGPRAHFPK
jgi:hypothetical protein